MAKTLSLPTFSLNKSASQTTSPLAGGGGVLRNKATLVWGLRFGLVVLVIWGEVGEFFHSISTCHFPDSLLRQSGSGDSSSNPNPIPTHVILISDPQIPHPTLSYPYSSALMRKVRVWMSDLYMRKSWNVIMRLGRIDAVIVAGDMMDWGRGVFDDEEYESYVARFKSIFKLPPGTHMHFVPGNQDVGLGPHRLFSPYSKERYAANFSPANALLPIANHTFILLDAVSLVEEDYRRYAAEVQLGEWEGVQGGVIEFIKALGDDPPPGPRILITHIPLARPETAGCGSMRERGGILKGAGIGYQNLLGSETSSFLINNIKPSLIYSGDDHDYCEYWHPTGVREVTLKSFSPGAEIHRPGFQLLSLVPPTDESHQLHLQRTYADVPCLLPDQREIYMRHYVPFLVLTMVLLFTLNIRQYKGRLAGRPHSSPTLPSSGTPNGQQFLSVNVSGSSKKEKPLPLMLPSRRSSTGLNLQISPSTPIASPRLLPRTPSVGSVTQVRRITKSAPASPLQSPRQDAVASSDSDLENGHGITHDAIYMAGSNQRIRSTSHNSSGENLQMYGEYTADEPTSYFLPSPGNAGSRSGLGGGMPIPYPQPQRRPSGGRKLTSRPSDWVSAAKAKDMTVLDLVFAEAPGMSRARRWLRMHTLLWVGRLMGGRHGVLARTFRDTLRISWPPMVVWLIINLMYFM